MSPKKNEMPVQNPDIRKSNFSEVALGYTKEQAIESRNIIIEAMKSAKLKNM